MDPSSPMTSQPSQNGSRVSEKPASERGGGEGIKKYTPLASTCVECMYLYRERQTDSRQMKGRCTHILDDRVLA